MSTPSNRCRTSTHMTPISNPETGSMKIRQRRVLETKLGM
jgi:hypothetical protein